MVTQQMFCTQWLSLVCWCVCKLLVRHLTSDFGWIHSHSAFVELLSIIIDYISCSWLHWHAFYNVHFLGSVTDRWILTWTLFMLLNDIFICFHLSKYFSFAMYTSCFVLFYTSILWNRRQILSNFETFQPFEFLLCLTLKMTLNNNNRGNKRNYKVINIYFNKSLILKLQYVAFLATRGRSFQQ